LRFAAIADVHGNHLALEAVLADIRKQGVTAIVNLGDCFSGPLTAGKTAEVLLGLDALTVRGNHDRYLIERAPEAMHVSDRAAHSELTDRHLEWLRGLPFSANYLDEVYLCHATPTDDNEALAAGIDFPLILCGHTHIPRAVRLSDGRLIVNPGSVGCPAYDDDLPHYHKVEAGHPFASYAILEKVGDHWLPAFRQVAYDHMAMAELAAQKGREEWASGLATGWLR